MTTSDRPQNDSLQNDLGLTAIDPDGELDWCIVNKTRVFIDIDKALDFHIDTVARISCTLPTDSAPISSLSRFQKYAAEPEKEKARKLELPSLFALRLTPPPPRLPAVTTACTTGSSRTSTGRRRSCRPTTTSAYGHSWSWRLPCQSAASSGAGTHLLFAP